MAESPHPRLLPAIGRLAVALSEPVDFFAGARAPGWFAADNLVVFARSAGHAMANQVWRADVHHRFVLVVAVQGQGNIHVDDVSFALQPGQAVLVFPHQLHYYRIPPRGNMRWVFFGFESAQPHLFEVCRLRRVELGEKELTQIQRLLRDLQASPAVSAERQLLGLNALLLALTEIAGRRSNGDESVGGTPTYPDWMHRLWPRLRRLETDLPKVATLARETGMSESTFRRRVRAELGVPVGEFLRHYRANDALRLLRTSRLTLTEIAAACGYGSLAHFSRAFRQRWEISPREWRRRQVGKS